MSLLSSDTSFEFKFCEVRGCCFCISQGPTGSKCCINTVEWTAYLLEQKWWVLECFPVDSTNFQTNSPKSTHKIKSFGCIYWYITFCLTLYLMWPLMFLWVRAFSWQSLLCRQNANTTIPGCSVLFPIHRACQERHHVLSSSWTPLASWFTFLNANASWIVKQN